MRIPFLPVAVIAPGLLVVGCTGYAPQRAPVTYAQPVDEDEAPPVPDYPPLRLYQEPFIQPPDAPPHSWARRATLGVAPSTSWSHDAVNDVATAGMTVGGLEAMQRLKAAQAARAAEKLSAPELPVPAAEGAAGATAERKLAGKLLTREGAAVAAGAAEEKAAGTLLLRGAVAAEEGEGLGLLLRLLLFL